MKKILTYLLKKKMLIIMFVVSFFLFGFLATNIYNNYSNYYTADFQVNCEFEENKLIDVKYLNSIKNSTEKYANIDVEKMLDNGDFTITFNDNIYTITTKIKYYDTFFNSKTKNMGTRAKTFIKDSVLGIVENESDVIFLNPNDIVEIHNYQNPYLIALYSLFLGFIISLCIVVIMYFKNDEKIENKIIEYDNENLFKHCFNKNYFKQTINSIKNVKDMTCIAMLFALMMVCKLIKIPSGFADLGLSFTYLFFATICLIYGPFIGLFVGIFSDIIGFIIVPNGIFFFPYTIQAALTGLIYGICLYKTNITFLKVLFSRFLINIFMNVIYGSFCFGWLYNHSIEVIYSYMLVFSLPKNLIYLLPQSILLYYVLKATIPILYRFRLINKKIYQSI